MSSTRMVSVSRTRCSAQAVHRRAGTHNVITSSDGPRLSSAPFHAALRPGHEIGSQERERMIRRHSRAVRETIRPGMTPEFPPLTLY